MFCKKCGTQIPDHAKFCPACGSTVSAEPTAAQTSVSIPVNPPVQPAPPVSAAPAPATTTGAQKGGNKKKIIILIIVIAVLLIGGLLAAGFAFGLLPFGGNNPKQAFADYIKNDLDYSVVDTATDTKDAFGVVSVVTENLGKDAAEDMVLLVADTSAEKESFYLNSYTYDEKERAVKPTAQNTALSVLATDAKERHTTVYKTTVDKKEYFIFEHLQLSSLQEGDYNYFVSVFSSDDNGVLKKEGALNVTNFNDENISRCVVYTDTVPHGMKAYDNEEYSFDNQTVLFAQVKEYSTNKELTDYYESAIDVLTAFFKLYNIKNHPKADSVKKLAQSLEVDDKNQSSYILTCTQKTDDDGIYSSTYEDHTQLSEFVSTAKEKKDSTSADGEQPQPIDNVLADKLLSKIQFPDNEYIYASLFEQGGFDAKSLTEEQILQMAFAATAPAQPTDEEKSTEGYFNISKSVPEEDLVAAARTLFGSSVKVNATSFPTYEKSAYFLNYHNMFENEVKYAGGQYTVQVSQGGGGDLPFVDLFYSRSEKVGDEIKLYVKPAFIDVSYNADENEFVYLIYTDAVYGTCYHKLTQVNGTDYWKDNSIAYAPHSTSTNNIHMAPGKIYESLFDKMSEYCFTFHQEGGAYYLSSFLPVKNPLPDTLNKQLEAILDDSDATFKKIYVEDYDGDGEQEAFAIIGKNSEMGNHNFTNASVYFINNNFYEELETDTYGYLAPTMYDKTYCFFSYERSAGGSGSTTHVYGVKNGKPIDMHVDTMDFKQDIITGEYSGLDQSFENGFHDYIPYAYSFDENSFSFIKGKKIGN